MLAPRLIPESTRSGALSFSTCRTPMMTLSVGVPRTAKARSSTLRMRKGSCRESEWLAPDWLLSGATTQTSSLNLEAISRSACRPGESMPSSFVRRMRMGPQSIGDQPLCNAPYAPSC